MPPIRYLCLLLVIWFSQSLAQDGYEVFPTAPGSRYKLYSTHRTWADALSTCQADSGGSHLIVINSADEGKVVSQLFDRITDTSTRYLFVGIDDIVQEGTWVTMQGGLVSVSGYNLWAVGQPNGSVTKDEDCGAISRDVEYHDFPCDALYPFICEKPSELD